MSEIEILGLEDVGTQNTCIDDLVTENINLQFLGVDKSGSMAKYTSDMQAALAEYKDAIANSKEADEILVARADFANRVEIGGYKKISEFDTNFSAGGSTVVYDTCVEGAAKLIEYMDYLANQGMRVKAVFSIFSDGDDRSSVNSLAQARRAIETLKQREVVLAFISFGSDAVSAAKNLGFEDNNILQVGASASELRRAFDCLSKSVIENSKSVVQKIDDFFTI